MKDRKFKSKSDTSLGTEGNISITIELEEIHLLPMLFK